MPTRIDEGQLDLVTEIAKVEKEAIKKSKPTGHIGYNGEEDMMLQTGDRIRAYTLDGKSIQGYYDGTVRWNSEHQEWMLQIRTGETDATDLSQFRFVQLLDQ